MPVDLISAGFTTSAMNVRTRSRMSSSSGVRVKSMAMATPGEVDGSTLVRLAFGNEAHGQPARGVSTSTATIFVSPFPATSSGCEPGDTNP